VKPAAENKIKANTEGVERGLLGVTWLIKIAIDQKGLHSCGYSTPPGLWMIISQSPRLKTGG